MTQVEKTTTAADVVKSEQTFDLSKADPKIMRLSAEALGVEVKKGATETETAAALISFFREQKKAKGKKLLDCDNCGGGSTDDLDACPYCGLGEEDEEEAEKPKAKAEKPPTDTRVSVEEKEANASRGGPAGGAVEEKPGPAKANGKGTNGKADGAEHLAAAQAAGVDLDPPPAPGKGASKGRKRADDPAPRAREGVPEKVKGGAALAVASRVVTDGEKRLDEAVAEIRRHGAAVGTAAWKIGQAIRAVYDSEDWKQRVKADGKTRAYTSFDAWVQAEVGIRVVQARNLMRVAAKFPEELVARYGSTKLSQLLRAPEEDQDRIMRETLAKNASKAEVEKEVRAAREKHGAPTPTVTKPKQAAQTAKASAAAKEKRKAEAKANEKITVAKLLGRETIQLFTAASMKSKPRKPVPARSLKDDPVGSIMMTNDVGEFFSIVAGPKGLKLVVVRKRVEE